MTHERSRILGRLLLAALISALCVIPAFAQVTYGGFRGLITDPANAPVPNVVVTVTSQERGYTKVVKSDNEGNYEIPSILEGTYNLTASAPGFKQYTHNDLILYPRDQRRLDIQLQVGEVNEKVTVTGEAAVVETESAAIATARPESWMIYRPGRWRAGMPQFELFQMGQQGQYNGAGFAWVNHGSHGLEMRASHDGMEIDNSGPFRAPQFSFVETKVTVVNAPAEFQTAGTAQAISRGGTNDLHGTFLLQYENWALNALGPNSRPRPPGVPATQFEGTIGGPVIIPKIYNGRNRTFWNFVTRQTRSTTANLPLYVFPQPQMRTGDLSVYSQAITDPTNGTPFLNNQIPANRISPVATKLMSLYMPLPNTGDSRNLSANYAAPNKAEKSDQRDYHIRGDQRIGSANMFSVVFFRLQNVISGPFDQNPTEGPYDSKGGARSIALQDTHTFTPRIINESGFSRINVFNTATYGTLSGKQFLESVGLTNLGGRSVPDSPGAPRINMPGFGHLVFFGSNIVGANQGISNSNDIRYIGRDNVSLHYGRHIFKTGISFQKYVPNSLSVGGNSWGTYNFTGFATGNTFADFLLGIPSSTAITRPRGELQESHSELGLYFQDEFKVTSRLTWSLGLRWQRFSVPVDKNGLFYNFDVQKMAVVVQDDAAKAAVHPAYPKGIPIMTAQEAGYPNNLVPNWKGSGFEPRIGVAWRPIGNNFVVRSGFGIYHVPTVPGFALSGRQSGPFQLNENFGPNTLDNGVPVTSFANPFPSGPGAVGAQSVLSIPTGYKIPYTMQWNLTVETGLGLGFAGRVSYVGSKGTQWRYLMDLTQPFPSTLPYSPSRRPIQPASLYNSVRLAQNGGNMTYHGLDLEVSRRFSKGLYFQTNFVWSQNLLDVSQGVLENGALLTDSYNRAIDKGRADSAEPVLMTVNMVADLPFGRGRMLANLPPGAGYSVLNHIIGGWHYSLLLVVSAGQIFTPTYSGFDTTGTGISSGRPDAVCNDQAQRDRLHWWNPACFKVPSTTGTTTGAPLGRFGTAPRGMLRGPGYYSDEMGIFKDIHLIPGHEGPMLRFSVQANNMLNHPVQGGLFGCNTNTSSPAFGTCNFGNPSWWAYPGRHVWLTAQIVF